ncbi:MAG TPA: tRNA-dihydrouridine synthase [Nitrospira sp.]|nr:tRNA-dihydrouridine synthase [Nitrospira sp.]
MSFWLTLPRPIIGLSPMDGVTDSSFRSVIARQGKPDVTFTEFTHVHDICHGPEKLLETLVYSEIERPMVAQLYGNDPELFYQAAHAVCELGFDGLDINMGCPSKNVAASGSGAGLIRTPAVASAIMQAARRGIDDWASGHTLEQVGFKPARVTAFRRLNEARGGGHFTVRRSIPLSVKTRLGYDSVVVESWIEHLLEERPAVISLHGRTLRQMYRGEADWSAIARAAALAKGTGTLLCGNGDLRSLDEAVTRVRETGVDGVLVGRAVLGAPWFFRAKERVRGLNYESNRSCPEVRSEAAISLDQRFAVLLDHARQFQTVCGQRQFHRMRKHLGWYCKGFPHAAALRARMFRLSSVSELEAALDEYRAHRILDSAEPELIDNMGESEPMPASRCS